VAGIVVCGGSVVGLTAAMLLARDGHSVVVLEADPAAAPASPAEAWVRWQRRGVPQFRQPHNLFPRFRQELDAHLPGLTDELREAGCVDVDLMASLPPTLPDQRRRPGDERFRSVVGRRPVVEQALARVASREPGVSVRRGVEVQGFLVDGSRSGSTSVTGVVVDGEPVPADLVVDAMGRRSPATDWLRAAGAPAAHLESSDAGFVSYTRYFTGPRRPQQIGPPAADLGTFSILTLPGDNGTWSVTLYGSNRDPLFKRVREPEYFHHVVHALPAHAQWLQGEPITDVLAMAGIVDRYRRFVVDGQPIATGYAAVGDAWACTNPSAGRGLSVGALHAVLLRDAYRGGHNPEGFALAFDAATEREATPWYRLQRLVDGQRFAEIAALREGRAPELEPGPDAGRMRAFAVAMLHDETVFRAFLDVVACLATPDEVFARPGMLERLEPWRDGIPLQMPAPSRERLESLLS
jgi:2-polyprenyl-6-methoxyphenol hydroxylase-like FAD-dependent oxidoreductase